MKFCSKCGKEIDDFANVCWSCGETVEKSVQASQIPIGNESPTKPKIDLANNTVTGIAVALTLIGLICGILIIIFMISRGEIFGYDSWNYEYGGGRETSMGIAVFSGASLLIGLCMLMAARKNKQ